MRRRLVACLMTLCALSAAAQQPGPSREKTFAELMNAAMLQMHHGMTAEPPTSDPDHAFVRMMIPHHQGAVDMSKALLLYGKDRELQQLAKSIIAGQQSEIQLMYLWLARHPSQKAARKGKE